MLLSIIEWFSDLIDITPDKIIEFLRSWGVPVTPETETFYVIGFIVIVIAIVFIIPLIIKNLIKRFIRRRKTNKWRRDLIEKRLRVHYGDYTKKEENINLFEKGKKNLYIETKAQNIAPDDNDDPVESIRKNFSENLMQKYLNAILIKNNTGIDLYCVIGGSGMGKTTFVINLLKQYINKYNEDSIPYDIYLFSLGFNDTFIEIENIDKEIQRKSILILDALDENTEAVENYEKFIDKLEQLIKDFRIVIITCRTQFFDDKDKEPKESSLDYNDSKHGEILKKEYTRHYISVFNNEEIDKYIKLKFLSRKKRKKAKEIVEKCKPLMVRPMLLSYIDDLLDEKEADLSKIINIYKILIDKWLVREVHFWKNRKNNDIKFDELKGELYRFSKDLAIEIFYNQDKNGGLFLFKEEMTEFINNHGSLDYNYKGRSLVNRYANGDIKFAHKSFLEYFLAKQMFEGKISISFTGMDMAETFYQELCTIEMNRLFKEGNIIRYDSKKYGDCLIFHKTIKFFNITHETRFSCSNIFLSWETINDSLFSWLEPQWTTRLVIYNYQNNNENLILLRNKLLKLMNRERTSLFVLCDNISKELQDFDDNSFREFEVLNKEVIDRMTPEVIEQTLRYLSDLDLFWKSIECSGISIKALKNPLLYILNDPCEVRLYRSVIRVRGTIFLEQGFNVNGLDQDRELNININSLRIHGFLVNNNNENSDFSSTFIYLLKDTEDYKLIISFNYKSENKFNETNIQNLLHLLEKTKDKLIYNYQLNR